MFDAGRQPSWTLRGALVDLDFKNDRYFSAVGGAPVARGIGSSTRERMSSLLTNFIAGGGGAANTYYAPDANGIYRTTEANALRITPGMGLWVENSATNWLLHCRNMTNAVWTASSMTASNTTIPGCNGTASGASRITATAGNATIQQNNIAFGMTGGDGITINSAGTGYAAGNSLTLVGGTFTTAARIGAKTVSGGGVVTPLNAFPDNVGLYTVRPTFPASVTGGAGSGATYTVNDTYIYSALVKRNAGSGAVSMTMDGGSTYTEITSQINGSGYSLVFITAANPSTISCGFKLATSGDSIDVDMQQLEACLQGIHYPTTRIVTTTVPVPRGNIAGASSSGEEAFYNNPSVSDGYNAGWKLIKDWFRARELSVLFVGSGYGAPGCLMTGTDLNFFFAGALDGGVATLNAGTSSGSFTSSNTGNFGLGNRNKAAFSLGGGSGTIYLNGVATTSTATRATADNSTHGGIGNRGAGDLPLNGVCERLVLWPRLLTPGEGLYHTS